MFSAKHSILKTILRNAFFFPGDFKNLRVWYDLEIHIHPEGPVHVIEMKCTALVRAH